MSVDETKLQNDVNRAAKARDLLESELLAQCFEALEEDYTNALFLTDVHDSASREKLYLAVNVVRKIKDHLNSVLADGRLADHQLRELAKTTGNLNV